MGGIPLANINAGVIPLLRETKLPCVEKPRAGLVGVAESYSPGYRTAPPPRITQFSRSFQANPNRGPRLSKSHSLAYLLTPFRPANRTTPGVWDTGLVAVRSN